MNEGWQNETTRCEYEAPDKLLIFGGQVALQVGSTLDVAVRNR